MTHITCRLTAEYRDQLRNPTLGNRVWATFTFTFLFPIPGDSRGIPVPITNPIPTVLSAAMCCSDGQRDVRARQVLQLRGRRAGVSTRRRVPRVAVLLDTAPAAPAHLPRQVHAVLHAAHGRVRTDMRAVPR